MKKLCGIFLISIVALTCFFGCNQNGNKTINGNKNLYNINDIFTFSFASGMQYFDNVKDANDKSKVVNDINIEKLNQHVNIFESTLGKSGQIVSMISPDKKHKNQNYSTNIGITITDISGGQKNIDAYFNEVLTDENGAIKLDKNGKQETVKNVEREKPINTEFNGIILYKNQEYFLNGHRTSKQMDGKIGYDLKMEIVNEEGKMVKIFEKIDMLKASPVQTFEYQMLEQGKLVHKSIVETVKKEGANEIKLNIDDDPRTYHLKKEKNYILVTYSNGKKDISIKAVPKTEKTKSVYEYEFEDGEKMIFERG